MRFCKGAQGHTQQYRDPVRHKIEEDNEQRRKNTLPLLPNSEYVGHCDQARENLRLEAQANLLPSSI